jgi:hypothetical protein
MWNQILAIAEMQFRSRLNLMRRESWIGHIVKLIFAISIATSAIGVLMIALVGGFFLAHESSVDYYLLTWNGIAGFFLFAWIIYFSHDIFRSDTIPLQRVMHLPVSPAQAFGMNFFQTWCNLPMLYFLTSAIGLVVGESIKLGPLALWQLAPIFLHALMFTAVTSLLQARIAVWLVNPRTRRLVLVLIPALVGILSFGFAVSTSSLRERLPSPANVAQPKPSDPNESSSQSQNASQEVVVPRPLGSGRLVRTTRFLDAVCPPMWIAACTDRTTSPRMTVVALMASMLAVSILALRSNYALTLKYYRNGFDFESNSKKLVVKPRGQLQQDSSLTFMESRFPGLDETYSSIVSMSWLSLSRSPEIKLSILLPLMQPVIMMMLFGRRGGPENLHWQYVAILALTALGLFLSSGFLCNLFGIDRSGFRFWVLSPIERHTILHARNIAFGLPALLLSIAIGLGIALFWDVSLLVMLESLFGLLAFFPLYLIVTNIMSILAPFPLPPGGMHPKEFSWKTLTMNLLLTLSLPFLLLWCCIPIGLEAVLQWTWPEIPNGPVALIGSVLIFWRSWTFYHKNLPLIGRLLQAREVDLLKIVTMHVEIK